MSHWNKALGFVLGCNVLAVGLTSLWHVVAPVGEEQAIVSQDELSSATSKELPQDPPSLETPKSVQEQLQGLEIPAELPEVPINESDPIYQDILNHAYSQADTKDETSEDSRLAPAQHAGQDQPGVTPNVLDSGDYSLIELRMMTTMKLAGVVRQVAREAEMQRSAGDAEEAAKLDRHVARLRRVIAELAE